MLDEQQFWVPGPTRVEIRLARGEIAIRTGEDDQARVVLSGSERLLEATTVALDGDTLSIRQRERGLMALLGGGDLRTFLDESVSVEVVVPRASRVDLSSAAADAQLTGEFGAVTVRSASGRLEARGAVVGEVDVKTVSGTVELACVEGDVRVRTVAGDLRIGSVDGSVDVSSVSGRVRLGSLRSGEVRIQSVSGDVELAVARGSRIDVDASSASGRMSSEVALADAPCYQDGAVVGIRVRTVSGDLRILHAPEREPLPV